MRDSVSSSTRHSLCAIRTRATGCTWKWMRGQSHDGGRAMISAGRFGAPRHDLVAALFGLSVGELRRETLAEHPDAAGVLEAPDDIGRPLARPIALLAISEDVEYQRREFQRHVVVGRQLVEQADILDDQVHRETDIAAAIEDHPR